MSKYAGTIAKSTTLMATVAALVATSTAFAGAAEAAADGPSPLAAPGAHYELVDSQGNVYVAAGQIFVYDSTGRPIDCIEVPERPSALVFGGGDRRTLFIAARSSLYAVRMNFPGR